MTATLKNHHRAKRVPGTKCNAGSCTKLQVANSKYCAHHRVLLAGNSQKEEDDLIRYGS